MTDLPATVSPADISNVLLGQVPPLPDEASPAEHLTWHESRARLLTDIAGVINGPKAHLAAADAWHGCSLLARRRHSRTATQ